MILSAIAKASWTMIVVNGEAEGQLANRVFHKLDKTGNNANIGIRGFTVWKQKIPVKNVSPVRIEPRPLINFWFQVQHSPFWANLPVLLRGSLNFCLCTTWFMDLDDFVGINRAWLNKDCNQ